MGAENKVHLIHIWKSVSKSEQSVLVSWGIMGSTRPGQRVCFTRPGYLLSLGAKCQAHPSSLSLPLVHPNFFQAANRFSITFSKRQEYYKQITFFFSMLCLEWDHYEAWHTFYLLNSEHLLPLYCTWKLRLSNPCFIWDNLETHILGFSQIQTQWSKGLTALLLTRGTRDLVQISQFILVSHP